MSMRPKSGVISEVVCKGILQWLSNNDVEKNVEYVAWSLNKLGYMVDDEINDLIRDIIEEELEVVEDCVHKRLQTTKLAMDIDDIE